MSKDWQGKLRFLKHKLRVFDTERTYLAKYQDIVIGNGSILSLLKYEFIVTMLGWIPGGSGIFLRKRFYSHLFKPRLRNVIFGKNVDIFNPNRMRIGKNCLIGDNCLLETKTGAVISIGDNVSIGRGSLIRCGLGSIEVQNDTSIAAYCNISAMGTKVKIGRYVSIAAYCYINGAAGYDFESHDAPMAERPRSSGKGIIIEDDVWLGAGVIVLDGNKIGLGSVVGAGSVVTKDIPEHSVAAGVPAKVLKRRK
jgi:acetyltransferase-like isoleucine patch superfamily enzyme